MLQVVKRFRACHVTGQVLLHRYQRYLETVLEVADEYQEVQDLIMRHATLQATNQDLKEHQHKCAELAEKTRAELNLYVKQKTDEILNLNNHLARLKKELESFEALAIAQESKKDYSLQVRVCSGVEADSCHGV
jgi:predicted nuclease with TOPRIM domain